MKILIFKLMNYYTELWIIIQNYELFTQYSELYTGIAVTIITTVQTYLRRNV